MILNNYFLMDFIKKYSSSQYPSNWVSVYKKESLNWEDQGWREGILTNNSFKTAGRFLEEFYKEFPDTVKSIIGIVK